MEMIFFWFSCSKYEVPNILEDLVVTELAKKHNKTPAQILLRFLVQQELVVIPKSTNPERLQQNLDVRKKTVSSSLKL